jgi:hypothetical protein
MAKSYDWLITTINVPETKNSQDKNVLQGLYGCYMQDAERLILGNAPITHITLVDDHGNTKEHSSFQIVDADSLIATLPLQRMFEQRVTFKDAGYS